MGKPASLKNTCHLPFYGGKNLKDSFFYAILSSKMNMGHLLVNHLY